MRTLHWLIAAALVPLLAASVLAEKPKDTGWFDQDPPRYRPMVIDNTTVIDANNIEMIVTNHGSFAYDLTNQDAGLWYPRGTDKTCVYAAGLWIGAKVGSDVRITPGSFTQEYTPGPILPGCGWVPDVGGALHKVYKIVRGDTTSYDYRNWPWRYGAPYDSLIIVGDDTTCVPTLLGDQTLWCVYNDADPSVHNSDEGSSANDPLGIEVQQTTFAFDWSGALGNVVFIKFKVINKCANTMDSTYFSVWCDPDVGGASDDYVGCDTTLSVGYSYNATNTDNLYGSSPPCPAFDFFRGPIVGNDTLPMTSFNKYINGTDPRTKEASWNYMRGFDIEGEPVINPITEEETKFVMSGDPVANTGWLDSDPADRRFMLNTGPFTMEPGDTQEVVVGLIVGQSIDRIGAVKVMKFYDLTAQVAFDMDFDLPPAPDRPIVTVAELDRKIQLSWTDISEVDRAEGYTFEGYNVYQSPSISTAGPWQLVATYDVINGLQVIEDLTLNLEFGVPIVQPVQFGGDFGLKRHIELEEDKTKGVPLNNGTTYYYKIGAYSYNPTPEEGLPKTLESFSSIIAAIPQEEASDVVLMEDFPEAEVIQGVTDSEIPPTTDLVTVQITNPYGLTGDEYTVKFREANPPRLIIDGEDTTIAYYEWNIIREDGDTLYRDPETGEVDWQINKTGDEDYKVFDGFLAKVIGSHKLELASVNYYGPDGSRSRALNCVDWGGGYKINNSGGPGADYGWNFFGSTLDPVANADQFTTVEVRFSHTVTQKAYRYVRPSYEFGGFLECPFTVWDVVTGKQLNACFLENEDPVPSVVFDSTWTPATEDQDPLGGREYLFIMRSEYDEAGGLYGDDVDGTSADVLYAIWPVIRTGYTIEDGSVLQFLWSQPATENDYFEFTPEDPSFSTAKAKGKLDDIRVVPNPYFAKSTYELNQFDHVIKFSNLPRKCTIRIFNLAGDLVKTIEKTDQSTSIAEWNLFNESDIPVASGFYIWHVDAPGIGSKYGKFAVFLEKERLNTF
jgi:hypothetical protein